MAYKNTFDAFVAKKLTVAKESLRTSSSSEPSMVSMLTSTHFSLKSWVIALLSFLVAYYAASLWIVK